MQGVRSSSLLSSTKTLRGRVAVVTGGATGIGRACAAALARAGAGVCIGYKRSRDDAAEAVAEIAATGARCTSVQADVDREHDVDRLFAHCERDLGIPDLVLYSAGISGHGKRVVDLALEEWEATIRTNLTGAFLTTRRLLRGLHDGAPGTVVAISSVVDEMPITRGAEYAVSKAGLRMLVRCLALEGARRNVRVNGIAPGLVLTRLNAELREHPDRLARTAERIPLRRAADVEEIATAAVFLSSDAAKYITGQTLRMDGGLLLNIASGPAPGAPR